jgi:hypothetical protein
MGTAALTVPDANQQPISRKRRIHRKSRSGCRNCRLRRVKCDERKPLCDRCTDFGVSCNYDPTVSDLQPLQGSTHVTTMTTKLGPSPVSHKQLAIGMIESSLNEDPCCHSKHLDTVNFQQYDMALLHKFQTRTVFCLGTSTATLIFQKEVVMLACSHRFLMHLIQAVTACHDRYLEGASFTEPDAMESYNLNLGLVLYQHKLTQPLRPTDRDALFVAASLTGIASFASIQTRTVEESWPLRGTDLNWLHLSSGKHAVVELVDPFGKDSMWSILIQTIQENYLSKSEEEPRCTVFDHLCHSNDPMISPSGNPYQDCVDKLAPLLELDCDKNESNWVRLLLFLMQVPPAFTGLLQQKDSWAMLMLAYWYAKVCQGRWWLARRGILEGLAICVYIERKFPWDKRLQDAVIWPKTRLQGLMALERITYS